MKYLLSLEQSPNGSWGVEVVNLPGCFSWGETREAAAHNAREAIEGHLEALQEIGEPLPTGADGIIDVDIVKAADVK
jgi:predicted RNase H-like HicB family nuclease